MARPRANVRKAEFLEKLADIAGVVVDAEALGDDPLEIDPSPAHHAVDFPLRHRLDDPGELGQLIRQEARLRTARPIVEEGFWSRIVEAMNPVAQGLAIHSADLGGLAAVHSVPNRSQRQKPSALTRVLRPPGQSPKLLSRIIFPQFHRCWHARILQPITSQKIRALGIPNESAG